MKYYRPVDDKLQRSMEKLKTMVGQVETSSDAHDPEWRGRIRGWMEEKRQERLEAYKKQRADLRDHEVNPYQPRRDAELVS